MKKIQLVLNSKFIITLTCWLLSIFSLNGQCSVIQNMSNTAAGFAGTTITGQSFIACQTGIITNITFNSNTYPAATAGDATLRIATGNITTNPDYTQIVTLPVVNGDITISLATPFPVIAGTQYAFSFQAIGATDIGWRLQNTDVLPGGNFFQNITQASSRDLRFSLNIAPSPPPIPSLSQWGLLIFGLVILNLSLYLVSKIEFIQKFK